MINGKCYQAKVVLNFVDRPTVLGTYTMGLPGEEHLMYTNDAGKTWLIPFGMTISAEWVKSYKDILPIDTRGVFAKNKT